MPPTLHFAVGSDIGRRRSMNQDSGCSSPRLLAVADGMGGHAHGEVASAIAIAELATMDVALRDGGLVGADLLGELRKAVARAAARLTDEAAQNPELRGAGTTVVAMLVDGTRAGIVHIGDSRAYLLRDGELVRLTRDHTLVQALVDEGRISAEEAADHPRRSVLVRTLQAGGHDEPDLFSREVSVGDRYLLCSDGVTAVLSDADLHDVLTSLAEPTEVVDRLIELANAGGGPDNITCVIADVVESEADGRVGPTEPVVVGAAAAI
ncbi:MAG: PP2C family serine/threonine-protein phosphatase [Pseudonocardia sp.]